MDVWRKPYSSWWTTGEKAWYASSPMNCNYQTLLKTWRYRISRDSEVVGTALIQQNIGRVKIVIFTIFSLSLYEISRKLLCTIKSLSVAWRPHQNCTKTSNEKSVTRATIASIAVKDQMVSESRLHTDRPWAISWDLASYASKGSLILSRLANYGPVVMRKITHYVEVLGHGFQLLESRAQRLFRK